MDTQAADQPHVDFLATIDLFSTFTRKTADSASRTGGSGRDTASESPSPTEPMADVVELPRRRDERRAQGS